MIIVNNVSQVYGANQILSNINLKINPGDLVFLIGNPGAGKTSLLKLITGIEKPSQGQINVRGRTISAISYRGLALARREMGIIMEDFDFFGNLTLYENLELSLQVHGIAKKERDRLIQEIANNFSISHKRHFLAKELSSQEKKAALIARAIIINPAIIIADDILENLEHQYLEKTIYKLNSAHEKGAAIILTARDRKFADHFPSRKRIISISQGKILHDEIGKSEKLEGILDNV